MSFEDVFPFDEYCAIRERDDPSYARCYRRFGFSSKDFDTTLQSDYNTYPVHVMNPIKFHEEALRMLDDALSPMDFYQSLREWRAKTLQDVGRIWVKLDKVYWKKHYRWPSSGPVWEGPDTRTRTERAGCHLSHRRSMDSLLEPIGSLLMSEEEYENCKPHNNPQEANYLGYFVPPSSKPAPIEIFHESQLPTPSSQSASPPHPEARKPPSSPRKKTNRASAARVSKPSRPPRRKSPTRQPRKTPSRAVPLETSKRRGTPARHKVLQRRSERLAAQS